MDSRHWHLQRTVLATKVDCGQVPITTGLVESDGVIKAALIIGDGPAVYLDLINGGQLLANLRLTLADRYYRAEGDLDEAGMG